MKKKIVGILVVTLLIATTALSVAGTINIDKNQDVNTSDEPDGFQKPSRRSSKPFLLPPFLLKLVNGDWNYWSNPPDMYAIPDGNVGIGTAQPQQKLHVKGISRFDLGDGQIDISTPGGWPGFIAYEQENGHRRDIVFDKWGLYIAPSGSSEPAQSTNGIIILENGNVGIGVDFPQEKLHVDGAIKLTGGSDIAEPFVINEKYVEPGMVVVIDSENPGHLKISTRAYDRCVAGVVSGAGGIRPGLMITQENVFDGGQNVALAGRVYALCDASYGSIEPGDLLTTSPTPGYAMKVTDYERSQGAILGKAMTSLDGGNGLVLTLVSLQ